MSQGEQRKGNRSEIISDLPERLQPTEIVDNLAAYDCGNFMVELTEEVFTDYFTKDEFSELDKSDKKKIMFFYQQLMTMLRATAEFENRTFNQIKDPWSGFEKE